MKNISRINSKLYKYTHVINYAVSCIENEDGSYRWDAYLELSDYKLLYGRRICVYLKDVQDFKMKSPNIGVGGVFQVIDIKDCQLENKRYYFEDYEEGIITCYAKSITLKEDDGEIMLL